MDWMKGRMTLYINIDRNQWTLYKLNELQKADGYISSERLYQRVTVMSGSLGSRVLSRRGDLRCQNIQPNVSNLTISKISKAKPIKPIQTLVCFSVQDSLIRDRWYSKQNTSRNSDRWHYCFISSMIVQNFNVIWFLKDLQHWDEYVLLLGLW